ncbi:pro-resilin-like [Atheta coriaria]|uniref:pro-resilin-like n=1 Tax=Dalotia coriaria TaxID=877792 RepID=UPI0031F3520F
MFKLFCLIFVIGCAFAEPPPSYLPPNQGYLPPGNGGPPSGSYGPPSDTYGPPNGGNGNGNKPPPVYGPPEDATEPAKYSFEWEVNDPESGNEYGQKEERDGDNTVGSYNVLLPDGRKQIVEYTVDKDGYHPVIKYEGEAKPNGNGGGYPSGKPNGNGNGGYRY